jgi:hypothetical protein
MFYAVLEKVLNSDNSLSKALITAVKDANLGSLSKDYSEVLIDSITLNDTIRDIPLLGTIIAIGRLGWSIKEQIFAKKLIRFLSNLAEINQNERIDMLNRLDNEDGFTHEVGDRLIEILDKLDSHKKPEMLARAFRAYAAQFINGEMLNRLNYTIEHLPYYEIQYVRTFFYGSDKDRMSISHTTLNAFAMAGIAIPLSAWDSISFKPNDVCEKFVNFVIGSDETEISANHE